MKQEVVEFPSLELVFDAIYIFANQNALTPKEVAEIFIAGSVATQAAGRELTGFPIMWGQAQATPTTREVTHG